MSVAAPGIVPTPAPPLQISNCNSSAKMLQRRGNSGRDAPCCRFRGRAGSGEELEHTSKSSAGSSREAPAQRVWERRSGPGCVVPPLIGFAALGELPSLSGHQFSHLYSGMNVSVYPIRSVVWHLVNMRTDVAGPTSSDADLGALTSNICVWEALWWCWCCWASDYTLSSFCAHKSMY